jgi:hypothetical protein
VTNQFFVFLIVIAGSDPQSVFLRLVASDYGINEIADNFLPLMPSQISAMTLGGSSSLG